MTEILKVSSRSAPNAVAGALASIVRSHGTAEVQVVGAGALNQAIKAMAIARGYVAAAGLDLHCRPTFADVEIGGQSRTAIRLLVETRDRTDPVRAGAVADLDLTDSARRLRAAGEQAGDRAASDRAAGDRAACEQAGDRSACEQAARPA